MKHQNSKEPKNQSLDRLLDWYDNAKKKDEIEIKKNKQDFINQIKKYKKQEIKNTTNLPSQDISLWMRIKKVLGIG